MASSLKCRIVPYIAQTVREEILATVTDASCLSVLFDGATDCSVAEIETVHTRVLNRNGEVKETFTGLGELEHAHAEVVRATLTVAPADVSYMLCLLAYTTVRVPSI